VLISDTHNKHEELGELPAGDVLIHAGDFAESAHPPKPQVSSVANSWHNFPASPAEKFGH
jgi:hypothetical protein